MNKIYLCSFASPDLKKTEKLFLEQAKKMNIYKGIKVFHYHDLNYETKNKIQKILKYESRGFGCWIWKPYIVDIFSQTVPKNSIIHYLDIGYQFNINGRSRFLEYLKICERYNFLVFQYKKSKNKFFRKFNQFNFLENQYSKSKLWRKFNLDNKSKIMRSPQYHAGCFFFKNNKQSKKFIKKWNFYAKKINLIDNKILKNKELIEFISHRNDQSIFSLSCIEIEGLNENNNIRWKYHNKFPLMAKRIKKRDFLGIIYKLMLKLKLIY